MKKNVLFFLYCALMVHGTIVGDDTAPHFETMLSLFDFWAPRYRELVKKTDYKILEWIREKASFLPDTFTLVLDLGCADGMIGEYMHTLRPDYSFIGVDFSTKMVDHCVQNGLYSQVIHADLSNGLPENACNKSFDIVTAIGCLEFIEHHECLFDQIMKTLKLGGQFWLTLQVDIDSNSSMALDTPLINYTQDAAYTILTKHHFEILDFKRNNCIYKNSVTQEPRAYFMIIAQRSN